MTQMVAERWIFWADDNEDAEFGEAQVVLITDQIYITPGDTKLLKTELRGTFPEAKDADITTKKLPLDCLHYEGKWTLVWLTPEPGIRRVPYPGWRSPRLEMKIHREPKSIFSRLFSFFLVS